MPASPAARSAHRPGPACADIVMLDIGLEESLLAPLVRSIGGRWNAALCVWEINFWTAIDFELDAWML